jgi:hypothetical protein
MVACVCTSARRMALICQQQCWATRLYTGYNGDEKDSSHTVSLCFISIMSVHVVTNTDVCIAVSLQPGLTQNITTALNEEGVDFIATQNIWHIYIVIISSVIQIAFCSH